MIIAIKSTKSRRWIDDNRTTDGRTTDAENILNHLKTQKEYEVRHKRWQTCKRI